MFSRLTLLPAVLVSAALALPAQADEVTAETIVATVNGQDITVGHLIIARAGLPDRFAQLGDDALFEGLLQQLTQQALLAQSLDAVPRRAEMALDNERRALLAGEAIDDLAATSVTDEAIQAAYEAEFASAAPEVEYNASHILVETEEEAAAIVEELNGGADFATLAQDRSTGPSGPNGGALGWFGAGAMVKPFEDAVVALEVGAISGPVQTQFGWHVIKLNESRALDIPPLEEVRDALETSVQRAAVDAELAALEEAAEITRVEDGTIDPSILSNFDLLTE